MKRILLGFAALIWSVASIAQTAYIIPKEADVNQEVKIFVNLNDPGCNCDRLLNTTEDIYIWSWKPSDPKVGNGAWNNSNDALKMTKEGSNLYSITIIPAEFYNITDVEAFYNDNIHLLVKLKDGSGEGFGKEDKSGDLVAEIDPLPGCVDKLCPFPLNFNQDDYFTIRYNNNIEEKPAMQNLAPNDAWIFVRCIADGVQYEIETFENVVNNPKLQMKYAGNGIFTLTFIPEEFFPIPQGAKITLLTFVVRRTQFNSPDDKTDGTKIVQCGCP